MEKAKKYYLDEDIKIENQWHLTLIVCPKCGAALSLIDEIECICGMVFESVSYVVIKSQEE